MPLSPNRRYDISPLRPTCAHSCMIYLFCPPDVEEHGRGLRRTETGPQKLCGKEPPIRSSHFRGGISKISCYSS